jgi:hypothetical protein
VVDLVKDLDDHASHLDGVGEVHLAAEDHGPNAFGHDGLAVAGGAVEKDGAPGVDGGAHHLQHIVVHDEVRQCLAYLPFVDGVGEHGLAAKAHIVVTEGHRRGADVLAAIQNLARAGDALGGDAVLVGRAPDSAGALDLAKVIALQEFEDVLHDAVEGQAQLLGDVAAGDVSPEVQDLDGQVGEEAQAQARSRNGAGLLWYKGLDRRCLWGHANASVIWLIKSWTTKGLTR